MTKSEDAERRVSAFPGLQNYVLSLIDRTNVVMAKHATKAPKKSGRKKVGKKTSKKSARKIKSIDRKLSAREKNAVLKKLAKIAAGPSHATEDTGPTLNLSYTAPLTDHEKDRRPVKSKTAAKRKTAKKKTARRKKN